MEQKPNETPEEEKISKLGCVRELVLFGVLCAIVASLIPAVNSIFFCLAFSGICGNNIEKETYSPDKQLKAVVFVRDCGALGSAHTHISVLRSSEDLPNEAGNTFSCRYLPLRTRWVSPRKLKVEHEPTAASPLQQRSVLLPPKFPFKREEKVLVEFQEMPAESFRDEVIEQL